MRRTQAAAAAPRVIGGPGCDFIGLSAVSASRSPTWNGQEAAFRFYMTILAVLIFVNQPDGELSASGRRTSDMSEG
jgi:hypothetical protein